MKLYTYFRSSAAYRTRIALNLKGLPYETVPVHLVRGEQRFPAFEAINPQMRLPTLTLSEGETLIQSLAIIEYLDDVYPDPPLLPADATERAHVRAAAHIVACDIHPLNNSGPLAYLRKTLGQNDEAVNAWIAHWITAGFAALEKLMRPAPYSFGAQVTMADICLVPQVASARRFKVPLDDFPKIVAVDAACAKLSAFEKARPDRQADAE
ncbi:MAG: maleylacetoacetate isomerase [Burkholderiaceae bacterium]|nr:maleylacetoacetate isomerase [Burkholderiaceae bacterium]